jgi:hypothetical protein
MDQWDIARCSGVCAVTGRTLAEGEEHYAVLFEEGEGFRRADFGLESWTGPPPGAYCFFRTRVPVREKKKRLLVDDEVLVNFFIRLGEDENQEARHNFRFVLALILMRKRLLKYEDTKHENGHEYWIMRLVREQSVHRVRNPHLTEDQIAEVSRELGAILHGDVGTFADSGADDSAPVAEEAGPEETAAHAS